MIKFLSRPASYGLQGTTVERIETHCSIVFLAGDRAYKLKRTLRYASLDYTTRQLRQAACEAELELNRRTAPDLYLAVQAIHQNAGGLAFDGAGPMLDHVVVMRRFEQAALFDRMAERGLLTGDLMRDLGRSVAEFHAMARVTPGHGGCDAMQRVIADNDRELARVASALDHVGVGYLSRLAHAELAAVADLLDRRREDGRVRRCHGDLRLANICLYAGHPTLFDCIEFSEEIGCIDVLYDPAFLLMDLQLRDRGDLANIVFNAYLDAAPETDGLRTLPLFLALRTATRAYALAGAASRRSDPAESARLLASARRHILAGTAFLAPHRPMLVALGGGCSAGRRAITETLAGRTPPVPGARVLHIDPGSPAFGADAWQMASAVLAAGCSVLAEGDFGLAGQREAAAELVSHPGLRSVGLWLGCAPSGLDRRFWLAVDTDQGMSSALAMAGSALRAAASS